MNDTTQDASRYLSKLMKQKTAQERLMMGFSMFDMAKMMVIESLKTKTPHLSPKELKQKLFLRFYGADFNKETTEKIIRKLHED